MLSAYDKQFSREIQKAQYSQSATIKVRGGFGYSDSQEARKRHFVEQQYVACKTGSTILVYSKNPRKLVFQVDESRRVAVIPFTLSASDGRWSKELSFKLVSPPPAADAILDYLTNLHWTDAKRAAPDYLQLETWLHSSAAPVTAKWGETRLAIQVKRRNEFPGFDHVSVYTDDSLHALVVEVTVSKPELYRVSQKRILGTGVRLPYWTQFRRMHILGTQ